MQAPYKTNLQMGGLAYVAHVASGQGNNVRSGAGTGNARLYTAPAGRIVQIRQGPEEAQGMLWWEVDVLFGKGKGTHLTGWTSEGHDRERWLRPITPQPIVQGACAAPVAARLALGDQAYVDDPLGLGRGNNLREPDGTWIETVPLNRAVRVIGGPICSRNMVWWKVRVQETGRRGWMSEADPREGYNLVPLQMRRNRPGLVQAEPGRTAFTGRYKVDPDVDMSFVPSGDGQVVTLLFSDMMVQRPPGTGVQSKRFSIELGVNSTAREVAVRQDVDGYTDCESRGRTRFRIKDGERVVEKRWNRINDGDFSVSTGPTVLPLQPDLSVKFALDAKIDTPEQGAYLTVDLVEIVLNPPPLPPPDPNG